MNAITRSLAVVVLFSLGSWAKAADYTFDTAHTQIFFTLSHMGFSHSTGQFIEFDGGFSYDPDNIADSSVDVTIKTASVDLSNHAKWIGHVTSPDLFDSAKYPDMTFKSTKVTVTGDNTMKVAGDLTIKGTTKPVVLDVVFNKMGKAFGQEKIGFSATATIDRTDFGLNYGVPGVGAEVDIRIEVEGVKS